MIVCNQKACFVSFLYNLIYKRLTVLSVIGVLFHILCHIGKTVRSFHILFGKGGTNHIIRVLGEEAEVVCLHKVKVPVLPSYDGRIYIVFHPRNGKKLIVRQMILRCHNVMVRKGNNAVACILVHFLNIFGAHGTVGHICVSVKISLVEITRFGKQVFSHVNSSFSIPSLYNF